MSCACRCIPCPCRSRFQPCLRAPCPFRAHSCPWARRFPMPQSLSNTALLHRADGLRALVKPSCNQCMSACRKKVHMRRLFTYKHGGIFAPAGRCTPYSMRDAGAASIPERRPQIDIGRIVARRTSSPRSEPPRAEPRLRRVPPRPQSTATDPPAPTARRSTCRATPPATTSARWARSSAHDSL